MVPSSKPQTSGGPWDGRYSQDLIDNLPVGVYICNRDAVVVAYNLKAAEIWAETPVVGDPEVKFCGCHKLYSIDGHHVPHDQTPMAQVLVTGEPVLNMEAIIERRDGSRRYVIANIIPLFDDSEDLIGFSNCVQDVTVQREREHERLRLVRDRFQAQKMELVGQLTAGIAHDFNNMLTAVKGSLSLADRYLERNQIEQAKKFLASALRGSESAGAMTARLMAFSRHEEIKLEILNVNSLIVSIVELAKSSLSSTIDLSIALSPDIWNIKVDPHQLESSLLNLMVNAKDAMPLGGRLTISTENIAVTEEIAGKCSLLKLHQSCVCINVTDSGIGMSAQLVDKIFEPFFTTKEVGKGTGLGLAMVYGYVIQSGGCLSVESEEGKGTTFSLFFPQADELQIEE